MRILQILVAQIAVQANYNLVELKEVELLSINAFNVKTVVVGQGLLNQKKLAKIL
jgi:hypothetical protein